MSRSNTAPSGPLLATVRPVGAVGGVRSAAVSVAGTTTLTDEPVVERSPYVSTAVIRNVYCPVGRMPLMTVTAVASAVADCNQ